jgi:DNA-directed RNA polymerase subunit RPC12/RpoP
MAEEQAETEMVQLIPCPHCGRKFKEEALAKHVGICQKVFQQKRKVYNTTEHRLPDAADAPELAEVRRKAAMMARKGEVGIGQTKDDQPKKTAWKMKHEAFQAAMKDAKIVQKFQKEGRPLSELPPPQATAIENDDRVACPHCGRRFGQQQAERHIPHCAKTKAKAKPPPGRGAAGSAAPKGAPRKGRNA